MDLNMTQNIFRSPKRLILLMWTSSAGALQSQLTAGFTECPRQRRGCEVSYFIINLHIFMTTDQKS